MGLGNYTICNHLVGIASGYATPSRKRTGSRSLVGSTPTLTARRTSVPRSPDTIPAFWTVATDERV